MGLQYRTGQSRSQFQSMVMPTTPPCSSHERSHEVALLSPTSLDLVCMKKLLLSSYVAFLNATRCPDSPGYTDPTAASALLGILGFVPYASPDAEALASAQNAGYTTEVMPSCSWSASHPHGMVLRNSAHCRSPTVLVGQPSLA